MTLKHWHLLRLTGYHSMMLEALALTETDWLALIDAEADSLVETDWLGSYWMLEALALNETD